METSAFDQLTVDLARKQEAAAFVAGRLAHHALRGADRDPDVLARFIAQRQGVITRPVAALMTKAAATAVDTSSGLLPASPSESAFLGQVERVSPLAQLGAVTLRGNVSVALQVSNATASWAGEQVSKPVTALSFNTVGFRPLKLIAQTVVTQELADLSIPGALPITQKALISATAGGEATALFDPASTAIANVRPASLTAGLTPITPAGDFSNNVAQVLGALSGGDPSRPVLVVSFGTAIRLQAMLRDLRELGVKVIISSAAGNCVIGVDADGVLVTSGGVDIQRGTPTVQMDGAPDSPPTAATVLTSTWQRGLVALKVEHWINWTARAGAVATLTLA
jgi:hypothetical protein